MVILPHYNVTWMLDIEKSTTSKPEILLILSLNNIFLFALEENKFSPLYSILQMAKKEKWSQMKTNDALFQENIL